ncbi:DUF4168 domain-containing protein [Histidinibacterium lentulum]|uniref:DUF4168 domain-containing protein n=1 Tax=Histidinibacterium lentulum TaxID=2480588 RepID=A0A3N2R906_9RHOB|nr:DUF4168 domain-containing protein [Histidinibacterium lentulum]ROU03954.1 DUF4168 domain-containing protein [Histidinibacterium lentulum]
MITTRIFAAAALAGLVSMPALAQDSDMDMPMTGDAPMAGDAPMGTAEVTDEMVASFIAAALNVEQVALEYQPLIEAAADDAARTALVEEAQVAMAEAVETTQGITVEEYMAISTAAQTDAALNARLQAQLETELES